MELALLLVLIVVALAVAGVVSHNRFVRQRHLVEESWQQVQVELRRRRDLIPNVIETVEGYAAHERELLESLTAARVRAQQTDDSPNEQAAAEDDVTRTLHGVFAVAEGYPTLRADGGFLALQQQLAETEDRIAAGRRFYNGNVRALNTRIETFPSSLVAQRLGVRPAQYFELSDAPALSGPMAEAARAFDAAGSAGELEAPTRVEFPRTDRTRDRTRD